MKGSIIVQFAGIFPVQCGMEILMIILHFCKTVGKILIKSAKNMYDLARSCQEFKFFYTDCVLLVNNFCYQEQNNDTRILQVLRDHTVYADHRFFLKISENIRRKI